MFTSNRQKLTRAALAAVVIAGAAGAFLATGAEPAMALCKYGTPHCVNPNPGPKLPTVGGAKFPDSGWEDPDCKYYRNCGYASRIGHGPSMRPPSGGKLHSRK
jgi:hypothetical protein